MKNLIHRKYLILTLIILIVPFCKLSSQESFEYGYADKNELKDFPFQFGLEGGPALKIKGKNFFENGFWLYTNLNLYKKRIFARFEYGLLNPNEELGSKFNYFFLGFGGVPLKIGRHSLSLILGLSFYGSETLKAASISTGVYYLFNIYKSISLTAGLKMPAIRGPRYEEYYYNPMITIGVQIF